MTRIGQDWSSVPMKYANGIVLACVLVLVFCSLLTLRGSRAAHDNVRDALFDLDESVTRLSADHAALDQSLSSVPVVLHRLATIESMLAELKLAQAKRSASGNSTGNDNPTSLRARENRFVDDDFPGLFFLVDITADEREFFAAYPPSKGTILTRAADGRVGQINLLTVDTDGAHHLEVSEHNYRMIEEFSELLFDLNATTQRIIQETIESGAVELYDDMASAWANMKPGGTVATTADGKFAVIQESVVSENDEYKMMAELVEQQKLAIDPTLFCQVVWARAELPDAMKREK